VHVRRNAVSVYYEYAGQAARPGRNEVSGSAITLVWDGSGFKRAQVTGGAAGGYYPHETVRN
jgi:hypothetical protein